ncbi:MAG: terminase [Solobacterium sp.]|nr:terminase [Solobacterium sp.]
MAKPRIGRQTPTQSVVLPYKHTLGQEAIDLYNTTGRTAQEWQVLQEYDILATNKDGLWTHSKYGYAVPRRNGKNEVVAIREMYGLVKGEHILHTAHRVTTTHASWERLYDLLTKAGIEITSSYRAYGKEHIEIADGGKIEFRTRTSKGGLGEGFDLLIIDEAQEYQDDQESALKYVVTDSKNPQTIFCGTPPTPVSSGTVFTKMRESALRGESYNTGWAEWSVETQKDPHDVDAWYETNPSLGTILTERAIMDEVGSDVVDFNIQRLGYWIQYNLKSAISKSEWEELKVEKLPKLRSKLFVGIKYGNDGTNVAMSVAAKTYDNRIFIEGIDCQSTRTGTRWLINFLREADVKTVVIDGANGQKKLADDMKRVGLRKPILPTVKEVIASNYGFEQAIFEKTICHKNQPSLMQIVSNCEHRAIGSNGGYGFKAIREGMEIALLDSACLAFWAASESKETKTQKISY